MPEYANGKNVLLKRPEPGRPVGPPRTEEVSKEKTEKEVKIDVNAIASAVVKAIGNKLPSVAQGSGQQAKDDFDDSRTLERLADSMSTQQGQNESNFEGLGKVKKTKKDQKDVQKTIDILSDIDE